jgi:hypothetical protein
MGPSVTLIRPSSLPTFDWGTEGREGYVVNC